jgi:hypothetical protein
MALPTSGSISTDQIRDELDLAAGMDILIPSAAIRTLTGISSGNIRLPDDFWGKSNVATVGFISGGTYYADWQFAACDISIWTNGNMDYKNAMDSPALGSLWKNSYDVDPIGTFQYMFTFISGSPGLQGASYDTWYTVISTYPANGGAGYLNGNSGKVLLTIRQVADHSNTDSVTLWVENVD